MKVVLFCAGLGTRIREYSETIPKPMIPVGSQPILWHIMQYYSQYDHRDFVLCLGYKANVIKDYFLNYRPSMDNDCVVSEFGNKIEILGDHPPDWRVNLIDTGVWRNIGERLSAVRELVKDEEVFLANYSDGLTDVRLPDMIDFFKNSGKIGCFIAVRAPFNFHLAEFDQNGVVSRLRSNKESETWINGGYFIFRKEIFDYIHDGEELVLEPFNRLIEAQELVAYKYEGFWRAMDTLRDKQVLEEMVEQGKMPWLQHTRRNRHVRVGLAQVAIPSADLVFNEAVTSQRVAR
jgi:glucose-1-phosphate cytidylyltransferase